MTNRMGSIKHDILYMSKVVSRKFQGCGQLVARGVKGVLFFCC